MRIEKATEKEEESTKGCINPDTMVGNRDSSCTWPLEVKDASHSCAAERQEAGASVHWRPWPTGQGFNPELGSSPKGRKERSKALMALRKVNGCSQQWPTADMAKIRGEICESGQQQLLHSYYLPILQRETKIHGRLPYLLKITRWVNGRVRIQILTIRLQGHGPNHSG